MIYRDQGQHFLDVFILNHNLERFTSTLHRHPGPFYYYLPVLLVGLFPWTGLAIPGLGSARPRRSRADLFVLAWLGLPLGFFSLAGSKLPGYILPCLPPLALLIGRGAAHLSLGEPRAWRHVRSAAVVGAVLGVGLACVPFLLAHLGEARWSLLLPSGLWALIVTVSVAVRLPSATVGALGLLRVGGAGFLLLLATSLPPILSSRGSGRDLFRAAGGQEVLVWGARRTAWMSGYFYNDGRVREVEDLRSIYREAEHGSVLVLVGPSEKRRLLAVPALDTQLLAEGPHDNVLLRVGRR
jgi:4-amino-4-deoxy-L-arabinose transferase-like glycosyltransferase